MQDVLAVLEPIWAEKAEAAYRRGDLVEKRRALMADWEQFLGLTLARLDTPA